MRLDTDFIFPDKDYPEFLHLHNLIILKSEVESVQDSSGAGPGGQITVYSKGGHEYNFDVNERASVQFIIRHILDLIKSK